jgi:hypothetical protein
MSHPPRSPVARRLTLAERLHQRTDGLSDLPRPLEPHHPAPADEPALGLSSLVRHSPWREVPNLSRLPQPGATQPTPAPRSEGAPRTAPPPTTR